MVIPNRRTVMLPSDVMAGLPPDLAASAVAWDSGDPDPECLGELGRGPDAGQPPPRRRLRPGDARRPVAAADVVVLIVPLDAATRGLVDAAFLARMRTGALLVNVSRGPVVDTNALLAECAAGRIRAALDVTDPEPLPSDHPLWRAPGVLISPHVGGNTSAFLPRARRLVAAQLRRLSAGEPLANIVAG